MNNTLDIKILKVFKPIVNSNQRYNFIQGGRGSGKTTNIAKILLALSFENEILIMCCRSTKNSTDMSTYESIKKAIKNANVQDKFIVYAKTIVNIQSKSRFIFMGLGASLDSVQSVEDVKYCWVEEAHTVNQIDAFRILTPSIRAKGSKMFITFNPRYPNDPVEVLKKQTQDTNLVIVANYNDNPYYNDSTGLGEERLACHKYDQENYPWIWLGDFRKTTTGNSILPREQLLQCIGAHKHLKYQSFGACDMGVDISDGGADNPAYAIRKGALLLEAKEINKAKDCYDIITTVIPIARDYKMRYCYYDSAGVGAGFKSECRHFVEKNPHIKYGALPFEPKPFLFGGAVNGKDKKFDGKITNGDYFAMQNIQAWWNLRVRMLNTIALLNGNTLIKQQDCLFIRESITNDAINQLSQAEYVRNERDKLKVIKDPNNFGSPDIADAIVMSYAYDIRRGIKANYV